MEAVAALYAEDDGGVAEAIVGSLSRAVFEGEELAAAGLLQRVAARLSYRYLKRTTRRHVSAEGTVFHQPLLQRSGHPYAHALLASSRKETEALVEGGDPMNGPYMVISPEIRAACSGWDRIFFQSVQSRDVQLRFIWETRATVAAAGRFLKEKGAVRMKAVAAGTGLSMILAYDRLLQEGADPARMTVRITDRDAVNTGKTRRLLKKLAARRGWCLGGGEDGGIAAETEDVFLAGEVPGARFEVVTAVGIFEYLQGFTCESTEGRLQLAELEEGANAEGLAAVLGRITAEGGNLIVNTFHPHSSTRILEVFGKKFDFRTRENMTALLATADFRIQELVGTGNIYDVKVYQKV